MGNGVDKAVPMIFGSTGPFLVELGAGKAEASTTMYIDPIALIEGEYSTEVATATIYEDFYGKKINERLSAIEEDLRELREMIQENLRNKDNFLKLREVPLGQAMALSIISTQIRDLPSEKYELKAPVDVILEIYTDEVLALLPELTLCGEGENELEAINDLKVDIIDLLEDLEDMPQADLGTKPKLWKRSLELMVKRCQ